MKRPFPFHSNAVWPSAWLMMSFVILYCIVAACLWLIESVPSGDGAESEMPDVMTIRMVVLVGAAGAYALYRLCRFHPALNQPYAAWLKLSPWTASKPLPLGPVYLVWQDLVIIGALTLIAVWHAHLNPVWPAAGFGLVYFGGMTLLLAVTRRWWSCLVLGFLWPALMLPGARGVPEIAIIIAIAVVAWHGFRESLKAFPKGFACNPSRAGSSFLQTEIRFDTFGGTSATRALSNVGWPFVVLSPKMKPVSISTLVSAALSALFGWWSFCVNVRFKVDPAPEAIVFFAIFGVMIRLAIYCNGITTPFSFWSRIVWGRFIVPGFDKVFLTPLAAVLVAIVGASIIRRSGSWYPASEACVIGVIWFVFFQGGPTLRQWVLTGQHRFRPPVQNKQMLRPI